MARIRTIKPEFFLHDGLYDLESETGLPIRISFVGLWCHADREGRFEWQPRRLGVAILPYDGVEFSLVLDALLTRGFLIKYASTTGKQYGCIPSFGSHQVINNKESKSKIPPMEECEQLIDTSSNIAKCNAMTTRDNRVKSSLDLSEGEGKGREGKGKGREGNDLSIVPSGEGENKKNTQTQNQKFDEEFEPFWKSLLSVNRAGNSKKDAKVCYRACRKVYSQSEIYLAAKHWEEVNLSRDPDYRKGLSAWLHTDNIAQVLVGDSVPMKPKRSKAEVTMDALDAYFDGPDNNETFSHKEITQ